MHLFSRDLKEKKVNVELMVQQDLLETIKSFVATEVKKEKLENQEMMVLLVSEGKQAHQENQDPEDQQELKDYV